MVAKMETRSKMTTVMECKHLDLQQRLQMREENLVETQVKCAQCRRSSSSMLRMISSDYAFYPIYFLILHHLCLCYGAPKFKFVCDINGLRLVVAKAIGYY